MHRDKDTGRFAKAEETERKKDAVAAGFHSGPIGISRTVWSPCGGMSLVDEQKFRNNYLKFTLQEQMASCRRVSKFNGLVRPVIKLRRASFSAGFKVQSGYKSRPVVESFSSFANDVMHEVLVTSNVVALWRKGESNPPINILNTEQVDYTAAGGVEKLTLRISQDRRIAGEKNPKIIDAYIANMGREMYEAYRTGKAVTIARGFNEEWDFQVMSNGKWEGGFEVPELLGLLDTVDFLAMMEVGDWNAANFRKDVIRLIKKGWKGSGNNAVGNSVDMTEPERDQLGEGFSRLKGNANIAANHDTDPAYLLFPSDFFEPKTVKSAIDRFLVWAGIEGVVLLGSFSQQNGAAPSLMRNHRTEAFELRGRVESFCRSILDADEFSGLVKRPKFDWSVKSLYSLDEIMAQVSGTADGIASPQTRREMMDLDDAEESRRMQDAHKRKDDFTPPFEGKQGLLGEKKSSAPGDAGRPGGSDPV